MSVNELRGVLVKRCLDCGSDLRCKSSSNMSRCRVCGSTNLWGEYVSGRFTRENLLKRRKRLSRVMYK